MYFIGTPCNCFILATVLLISARYGECLHCFQCQNVSEGVDCNVVAKCNNDESCYIERSGPVNDTHYSLGCMPRQNCPSEHRFTMVGRSVQTQCKKCCSVDGCNKRYCEPIQPAAPKPTLGSCIDRPSENCSELADLFNICSTPHRSKDICRKYCGLCDMVDGSWGDWRDWSTCSTTCGLGVESRVRQCNDPAPVHGGYDCPGNRNQQRSCFPRACPVDGSWGDWHDWSTCSITCGPGVESRTRQCNDPAPAHGGYDCKGEKNQQRSCFSRACPVHGGWSVWARWESCSESCGTGLKKRHRTCSNPLPSLYGHTCLGDSVEYSLCHGSDCGNHSTTASTPTPTTSHCDDVLHECDIANKTFGMCNNFEIAKKSCAQFCGLCGIVDGIWAVWSPWAECSTSCGNGKTMRTRTCSNPPPQNGGKACMENNIETKHCTLRACPVHGGWVNWAHWSSCSSTCGPGITRRSRVCDNPRPQLLGNFCFGDSTDIGMCIIKPCPVDGGWTDWSFWSSCSITCGTGHAIRQRSCSNPTPTYGGLNCTGPRTEQNTCHITNCPVNGGWSTWTSWSSCTSSVVRGLSQRQRSCTNPSLSVLGHSCIGDSTDKQPCPGVKSAFTVQYPVAGTSSRTIRFTRIITNMGGHYNTTTGIFTCVYNGTYVFALHIMKKPGSSYANCYIRKNGSNVVEAWTDPDSNSDNGYYSSTNSVVLHLINGDKVDLGSCSPIANIVVGTDTTFSGFLLRSDE